MFSVNVNINNNINNNINIDINNNGSINVGIGLWHKKYQTTSKGDVIIEEVTSSS